MSTKKSKSPQVSARTLQRRRAARRKQRVELSQVRALALGQRVLIEQNGRWGNVRSVWLEQHAAPKYRVAYNDTNGVVHSEWFGSHELTTE